MAESLMVDRGRATLRREGCDRATLLVSGDVDLATTPALRNKLRLLIAEAQAVAVVDLSALTFIDASGLSALVAGRVAAKGADVTLVLLNPSPLTRRLLEITGLDAEFEVR